MKIGKRIKLRGNSYKADKFTAVDYKQLTGGDEKQFNAFLKTQGIVRFKPVEDMVVKELQEYLTYHKITYKESDKKEELLKLALG